MAQASRSNWNRVTGKSDRSGKAAQVNGFILIDWHIKNNSSYIYCELRWNRGKFCRRLGAVDPLHPTGLLDCVLAGYHKCKDVDELRRLLAADKSQREMINGRVS
jgi:hypothetical protein